MKLGRFLGVALVLPALAACTTTPEPEPVFGGPPAAVAPDPITSMSAIAGDYGLVGYGTVPVPFTVERHQMNDCVDEITEGVLTLRDDGSWTYTYVERETCDDQVEAHTETVGGSYTLQNGRLHFDEEFGNDGPEGHGVMEARDFEVGWFQNGELRIEPEGIEGIWLRFRR